MLDVVGAHMQAPYRLVCQLAGLHWRSAWLQTLCDWLSLLRPPRPGGPAILPGPGPTGPGSVLARMRWQLALLTWQPAPLRLPAALPPATGP